MNILTSIGGRRFLMCMLVGLTTTILTYFGKIDGSVYSIVILGTIGVYVTGNTVQKVSNATNT
jgi:hypothetical protein